MLAVRRCAAAVNSWYRAAAAAAGSPALSTRCSSIHVAGYSSAVLRASAGHPFAAALATPASTEGTAHHARVSLRAPSYVFRRGFAKKKGGKKKGGKGKGGGSTSRAPEARGSSGGSNNKVEVNQRGYGIEGDILFSVRNLNKVLPGNRPLLSNVSLQFFRGAKIGVLGLNGAGKSTLLKVIAGIERDVDGEVWTADGCKMGYLPQEPVLDETKVGSLMS